jgi:hypothetical protein
MPKFKDMILYYHNNKAVVSSEDIEGALLEKEIKVLKTSRYQKAHPRKFAY